MTYDSKSTTITLEANDKFLLDSGVFFVDTLRKLAQEKRSELLVQDWQVLEMWLGCTGLELNQTDSDKIKKAWKCYIAIGLAPSIKLQPVFDKFSEQYRSKIAPQDKPPTEVMDVFDRMLATYEEIKEKRQADIREEKKKLQVIFANLSPKNRVTLYINSMPRKARLFVTFCVVWTAWVILRTSDYFEILGVSLYEWDDDMFLVNLPLPPFIIFTVYKLYAWIKAAKR